MKNISKLLFHLSTFFILFLVSSCNKNKDEETPLPVIERNSVFIILTNKVGAEVLDIAGGNYTNAAGNSFTVSKFKYYISNISFLKVDNTVYTVPANNNSSVGYYLVDEEKVNSKVIEIPDIPAGDYQSVSFIIGVDSLRNVSGDQSGALDLANGMFWDWNTGYIFLKMEGSSPQASPTDLTFHIGGFAYPSNTIRKVTLPLTVENITVRKNIPPEIHLFVDLNKMFSGVNTIDFTTLSNSVGDSNSTKIADNYVNMFSVDHVHNEPQ